MVAFFVVYPVSERCVMQDAVDFIERSDVHVGVVDAAEPLVAADIVLARRNSLSVGQQDRFELALEATLGRS